MKATKKERIDAIPAKEQKLRDPYDAVTTDTPGDNPIIREIAWDIDPSTMIRRVAVYARFAAESPDRISFELQKKHYEDFVGSQAGWELAGIYIDEYLPGKSRNRENFNRLMKECLAGNIDLVITNSFSRFSTSVAECVGYVRQLKAAKQPVGVYFETENIYTLDNNSEFVMDFLVTLAEEERRMKSQIMMESYTRRFKKGLINTSKKTSNERDANG